MLKGLVSQQRTIFGCIPGGPAPTPTFINMKLLTVDGYRFCLCLALSSLVELSDILVII